jgi:hypothetical protein
MMTSGLDREDWLPIILHFILCTDRTNDQSNRWHAQQNEQPGRDQESLSAG